MQILFMGMKSATKIRYLKESLYISREISDLLNSFRIRNYNYHFELVEEILKIKLITASEKMYLYKMCLLCITLQKRYEHNISSDPNTLIMSNHPIAPAN